MADEVRIGIVGARFAGSFHAECWSTTPNARVVAVADRDESARTPFAQKHAINRIYDDYRGILADPQVDLVDICVPNFLHAEVASAALRAGKDVVCEKPFATTLADGQAVLAACAETGHRFFYAEDWLFAPALVRAKAIMDEGGIGKPLYYRGKESHSGSHSPFAQKIRFCGGGSVIHLAVHPIGLFQGLLGVPRTIVGRCSGGGEANLIHTEAEGEDWGMGILSYDGGTQAVVEGNYITAGGMEDVIEIYGSEGVLRVDLTFGSPLTVYSRKGYGYAMEKADFTHGWTRPAVDENASLGYRDELSHFIGCLLGKTDQARGTTARDGYNVLRIVDAIYRSHREGTAITL